MSQCSGDPSNCSFCGDASCAKDTVNGCAANPAGCEVCKGKGCVAKECTGDIKTCKVCMGNFQTCRKAEVSSTAQAVEGIERAAPPAAA